MVPQAHEQQFISVYLKLYKNQCAFGHIMEKCQWQNYGCHQLTIKTLPRWMISWDSMATMMLIRIGSMHWLLKRPILLFGRTNLESQLQREWFDMMWYDVMMWCGVIWYDMIWFDLIWSDLIWYDMIWYDMIWYTIYDIWYMICGMVRCGVVWCGVVWCDVMVMWCDIIWYEILQYNLIQHNTT